MNMHAALESEIEPEIENAIEVIPQQRRWRGRHVAIAAIALALVAGAGWKYGAKPTAEAAIPAAATVGVSAPLTRSVVQWDDYVGRFAPSQTVEVRPRVSGPVTAIHFRDGDVVAKGQLLFTLDQRPFLALQAEARANVASARSALVVAQADYARANRLSGDEAISASELDGLRARAQSAQAALAAAQARLQQRALDVEFTRIRAPIAGRISDRRVDIGNLVSGGDAAAATLLTTINALDPIYFTFDSSEALFLKGQRDKAAAAQVEIRLQDEADYRWKGRLDFTDNGLDPRSGTIRGRAVLSNPGMFLTPGLFGNMRLSHGGTAPALLVPDEAIQSDQARKTVLVVGKDDAVIARPVVLGPVVEGLRIVRSGLAPNDRVIVSNIQAAAPGTKVLTKAEKITPQASTAAPTNAEAAAAQATFVH